METFQIYNVKTAAEDETQQICGGLKGDGMLVNFPLFIYRISERRHRLYIICNSKITVSSICYRLL